MPTTTLSRDPARVRASRRAAALVAIATIGLGGCSSLDDLGWSSSSTASGDYSTASIPGAGYGRNMQTGLASWDGDISAPGMTAAHPTLPLGSWARVTNSSTAASATVRINRRLMGGRGHSIELSRDAAAQLGVPQSGGVAVMIEPIDPSQVSAQQRQTTPIAPPPAGAAPSYPSVSAATGAGYDPSLSTASIPTAAAPAPAASLVDPVYLQLGSFRDPGNAQRMAQTLQRQRLAGGAYGDTEVTRKMVRGTTYYRVRVGPIESGPNAEHALCQARALGHKDARLTKP